MNDVRRITRIQASMPKKPLSYPKIRNHQRKKKLIFHQVNAMDGNGAHKIAENENTANGDDIHRVTVYCRVSTDDPDQTQSAALQKRQYCDLIRSNPKWRYMDTSHQDLAGGIIYE